MSPWAVFCSDVSATDVLKRTLSAAFPVARVGAARCPADRLQTDLLAAQAQFHAAACDKLARRANQSKTCRAPFAKIFRLTCRANQRHDSARLTADEGRWPSSRTRGEMRWTREPRLTCVALAYGEVVWS